MVPTVRDRILQTVTGRQLGAAFEDEFLDCSFAYRPRRSVNSAIARIRYLHLHGYRCAAEADIDKFFDRIDHSLLRQKMAASITDRLLLALIDSWIDGPVWDGRIIKPLRTGVPQGSPISPLLANLFLSDFDLAVEQAGMKLIRYADDFLILAQDSEHAAGAISIARDKMEELHLQLNDKKTHIGSFEDGFRFLGALFEGTEVWVPWDKQARNRHVLSVPQPMPSGLIRRWLEPPARTAMARAFYAAQLQDAQPTASSNEEQEMAFLYLVEQGSVLRKMGNRLVVEKDGSILLDTPYHKLEAVLIFGNVQVLANQQSISSAALRTVKAIAGVLFGAALANNQGSAQDDAAIRQTGPDPMEFTSNTKERAFGILANVVLNAMSECSLKRASLALCLVLAVGTNVSRAAGVCDAALILSTYNSFSSDHIDWRLATFVSEKEWEQIKHDQGASAVIFGIPVGETYSDFESHVKEKINVYHESLTRNQMLNILWTGLDPNSANAYSSCLQTQLFATRGLHVAVKAATKTDISLLVSWNPQGRDPATINPSWVWAGKGKNQLPTSLQQGQTTVVLSRPAQAHQFAVNYPGFTDSVVLEPLSKLPEPLPELAPVLVTETFNDPAGERPSGELDNFSVYYPICTPEKPPGWKIVSCIFSLSGDRGFGGPGALANETSHSETRVCWQFRLQGHSEERGHGNTGIHYSTAHLSCTWQHPK